LPLLVAANISCARSIIEVVSMPNKSTGITAGADSPRSVNVFDIGPNRLSDSPGPGFVAGTKATWQAGLTDAFFAATRLLIDASSFM
jgi:hypothetical protein